MGLSGLEPPTSRLSGVRSNQLSYNPRPIESHKTIQNLSIVCIYYQHLFFFIIWQPPILPYRYQYSTFGRLRLNRRVRDGNGCFPKAHRHQKYFVVFRKALCYLTLWLNLCQVRLFKDFFTL